MDSLSLARKPRSHILGYPAPILENRNAGWPVLGDRAVAVSGDLLVVNVLNPAVIAR